MVCRGSKVSLQRVLQSVNKGVITFGVDPMRVASDHDLTEGIGRENRVTVVEGLAWDSDPPFVDPTIVVNCPNKRRIALAVIVSDQTGPNPPLKQRRYPFQIARREIGVTVAIRIVLAGGSWFEAKGSWSEFVLAPSFEAHASSKRPSEFVVGRGLAQAPFVVVAVPVDRNAAARLLSRHSEPSFHAAPRNTVRLYSSDL
jgi:hypothetical protein